MEEVPVPYYSIADAEYDVAGGYDLCLSCAGRLRILTRPTRKEKGAVAEVGDVLEEGICLGAGEKVCENLRGNRSLCLFLGVCIFEVALHCCQKYVFYPVF